MGHIAYSDDQGRSWVQAAVPVSVDLTSVSFVTPRLGWVTGHDGVVLRSDDAGLALKPMSAITVPAGDVAAMPLIVTAPAGASGRHTVHFDVRAADGSASQAIESSFFGPVR